VPKAYFGYEPAEVRCRYEPMVVVDGFKAYAFLKELLQLYTRALKCAKWLDGTQTA
jgi:hypothetical protein